MVAMKRSRDRTRAKSDRPTAVSRASRLTPVTNATGRFWKAADTHESLKLNKKMWNRSTNGMLPKYDGVDKVYDFG